MLLLISGALGAHRELRSEPLAAAQRAPEHWNPDLDTPELVRNVTPLPGAESYVRCTLLVVELICLGVLRSKRQPRTRTSDGDLRPRVTITAAICLFRDM